MSWRYDPELDEVFTDPGERRLAAVLTAVQAPLVEPDPAFRSQLRRELMAEAWGRAEPKMPWWRRLSAPAPAAWGMATVGALLIAAAVFYAVHPGSGGNTVLVSYNVDITKPVASVQPLDVKFTQPMDRSSVEQAVQITPATTVDYQWVSDQEVKITPVAGSFAPNTQYTVSLQPNVAKSQSGAAVQQATPAVFNVRPTPTPVPSPTPSATPTPAAIESKPLAPAKAIRPAWLSSTTLLLVTPGGQLEELTVGGNAQPVTLVSGGVVGVAGRPDGQAALVLTQDGLAEVTLSGAAPVAVAGSSGALAFGYDAAAKPWFATPTLVTGAGHQYKLAETAAQASMSPAADGLVYQAGSDTHFLDLTSGKDTAWPAPAAGEKPPLVLGWSPDGKQLLYATAKGLQAGPPDGSSPRTLAGDPAVVAADWSADGSIVYATSANALAVVGADGSGGRPLATGSAAYQALAWQPRATAFTYVSQGTLSLASLTAPPPTINISLDDAQQTVKTFMDARVNNQAATAQALLASAARTAYPDSTLVPQGDPRLSRWFMVAAIPAGSTVRCDVRLVFADHSGRDVTQLDEVLTVGRDLASGKVLVTAARAGASRAYAQGPEVMSVQVGSDGKVHVQFDSDLQASSATSAVVLLDASGKPLATAAMNGSRDVVLTPTPGAAPGGTLKVLTTLHDKDGRPAVAEFDFSFGA